MPKRKLMLTKRSLLVLENEIDNQAKRLRGILNIFYAEQRRRRNFFLLWHMNKPSTTKGLNCCTLTEEKTFPHTVLWHKYYGYFVCSDKVYFGKTQMKW